MSRKVLDCYNLHMVMFITAVIDWAVSVNLIHVSVQFDIAPTR